MNDYEKMKNLLNEFECKYEYNQIKITNKNIIAGYSIDIQADSMTTYGAVSISFDADGKFVGFGSCE